MELHSDNELVMPKEFILEETKKTQYTKSAPRKWSKDEIEWMVKHKELGYTTSQLAKAMGRTEVSISIKLKRLSKSTSNNNYNAKHISEKYESNKSFIEYIKPKSVLDLYCGITSYYKNNYNEIKVVTNDINKEIDADYNMDAFKLICFLYYKGEKFDLIDLDPFGSTFDCLDIAIKMAKKGLIVTLGEMGHKRFKRLDFVRRMYEINELSEFTTENLIHNIVKIGERNKKKLTPIVVKEWNNISRVYFEISELKITEQWE